MHDILSDTWVFQEIIKEGIEKGEKQGLEKGEKQGIEKGEKKGLGEALLHIIEFRFPSLLPQANQSLEQPISIAQIRAMLNKLYRANTIDEAQTALQLQDIDQ